MPILVRNPQLTCYSIIIKTRVSSLEANSLPIETINSNIWNSSYILLSSLSTFAVWRLANTQSVCTSLTTQDTQVLSSISSGRHLFIADISTWTYLGRILGIRDILEQSSCGIAGICGLISLILHISFSIICRIIWVWRVLRWLVGWLRVRLVRSLGCVLVLLRNVEIREGNDLDVDYWWLTPQTDFLGN